MRIVVQRVSRATITINSDQRRSISQGLVVLLGIVEEDTREDIEWLTKKIVNLRVFDDAHGVMNRSVLDVNGEIMLVSQFTLHASTKKGNRPSYTKAAKPEFAVPLYEAFKEILRSFLPDSVQTGEFGAHMDIELVNDGPVTIIIDSKNRE
ncbi:MAG: D-aminoacyl-tRNA deacylase [Bacteroidota bacterium]